MVGIGVMNHIKLHLLISPISESFPTARSRGELDRLESMFQVLSGKIAPETFAPAPMQAPYSFFLPGLYAAPFHDEVARETPWARAIEENFPVILEELTNVLQQNNMQFKEYVGDGLQEDKGPMTGMIMN